MDRGLRIETIIAFSSSHPSLLHSFAGSTYYASGGQLIKEDISTGKQEARTIHHSPILSMHVSQTQSGAMLATGHSLAYTGAIQKAFVFITNPTDLSLIKTLDCMSADVETLRFSPDGAFLAAIDNQGKLVILGTKEFNVISSRFFEKKITCFEWGPIDQSKRMPEYHLVSTNNSQIEVHRMIYDIATITYKMVYQNVQLPNTGLNRYYECNTVHPVTNYYYAGTRGGELCIVDVKNKLFKASIQVGKSSLRSITMDFAANIAYCGFSNGQLKILTGNLDKWVITKEFQLDGEVISLDLDLKRQLVFVGTSASTIFVLKAASQQISVYKQAHNSEVVGIDVQGACLASHDKKGNLKFWNLGSLHVPNSNVPTNPLNNAEGTCVAFGDSPFALQGFSSGDITCINSTNGKTEWSILKSHKGGVSTAIMNKTYIITGGKDGCVRIWGRANRHIITQLEMHPSPVVRLLSDIKDPSIFHSCSVDKELITYDLRKEKKAATHRAPNGYLTDMVQKKCPEFELITCGVNNPVSYWDIDHPAAVGKVDIPDKLNCLDISPNGQLLALGSEDNQVYLVDTILKKPLQKVAGHSAAIVQIKWIDNRKLVSSSKDGSILIWSL